MISRTLKLQHHQVRVVGTRSFPSSIAFCAPVFYEFCFNHRIGGKSVDAATLVGLATLTSKILVMFLATASRGVIELSSIKFVRDLSSYEIGLEAWMLIYLILIYSRFRCSFKQTSLTSYKYLKFI